MHRRLAIAGIVTAVQSQLASAQTVVNSTFLGGLSYSDPAAWSPADVPNNSGAKQFNVTIDASVNDTVEEVVVDIDATISNLTLGGLWTGLSVVDRTFVVTGATLNSLESGSISVFSNSDASLFDAGSLSSFANRTLTGNYSIETLGAAATLRFKGADVGTFTKGRLRLTGPLAKIADENGNDALRNLERLEANTVIELQNTMVSTAAAFTNAGTLNVSANGGAGIFTAAAGLVNFSPGTKTLSGGVFNIATYTDVPGIAELRFPGADVVNLGTELDLSGVGSRIADTSGVDGLRNFAQILPAGSLNVSGREFPIAGTFRNDGALNASNSVIAIGGSLQNFDPTTRTLSGGKFNLISAELRFPGADIVANGASIDLDKTAKITDAAGNDALRNFTSNLATGRFGVGREATFTSSGDFTNAGTIETAAELFTTRLFRRAGVFVVPPGFTYTQTAGTTANNGFLIADQLRILGGSLLCGRGTIDANITIGDGTIVPAAKSVFRRDLTLSAGSHFRYVFEFGDDTQSDTRKVAGHVVLDGTLDIDLGGERFLSSRSYIVVLRSAYPITGAFSNAPNGARIHTVDGSGSFVVSYSNDTVALTGFQADPPPAQLLNISTRGFVERVDQDPSGERSVLIVGFVISGWDPKQVTIRGIGPSLAASGVPDPLPDPVLELYNANGNLLASNDDWTPPVESALTPADQHESVITTTLGYGAYTAVLREQNGRAGDALVEVYDTRQSSSSKLGNISTRGLVDADHLLIAGVIAGGQGQANAEVVVRAIGPSLKDSGISDALADPTIEVRNADGEVLAFNDDFTNYDSLGVSALIPPNNAESAIRLSLARGQYTAIVRPKPGSTGGIGLVESYDLRR